MLMPKKHCKNALVVSCSDIRISLEALRQAQERRDIDSLIINVEDLFVTPIWEMLLQLLSKQDRVWSIQLRCQFFTSQYHVGGCPQGEAALFKALSVLQYARFLDLSNDFNEFAAAHGLLLILNHLPVLQCLEMLHIENIRWTHDLTLILALPFVHKISGLEIGSTSLLEAANRSASSKALQRLREIRMDIGGNDEDNSSVNIINMASTNLPAIQRLDVRFPMGYSEQYREQLVALVGWLTSPNCQVAEWRAVANNRANLSVIYNVVPQIQTLRLLALDYDSNDDLDMHDLLKALDESPALDFLKLNPCHLRRNADKDLLDYQLACRPRMLEISVVLCPSENHTNCDKIHYNSLVYRHVKKIRSAQRKMPFPLSAWPVLLGKICDFPTSVVTIEETFKIVRNVLGEPHKLIWPECAPI